MGNSGSSSLGTGHGYRIISIEPNSFGSNLNLEIFLDYIIQIKTDSQINALKLLESDEPIELSIFNVISQETRKIYISEPRSATKLGLQIRYESINPLILHITNVLNSSPAQECGLQKNTDYLLGMMSHRYNSIDEFSDIVTGQAYSKQEIELCIFSPQQKKSTRIVKLLPRYNWGGPGALGCEFATGALHNLSFSKQLKHEEEQVIEQIQQTNFQKKQENIEEIQQQEQKLISNETIKLEEQNIQELQSILTEKQSENQEIDLSLSMIDSQISNQIQQQTNLSNKGLNSDLLIDPMKMSDQIKDKQNQSESSKEQEKKEQLILENKESNQNGNLDQTPTNIHDDQCAISSNQQDTEEQGEIHKFRGLLRFQEQGQEQYMEKEENKQIDNLNTSFQSKNGSSDYSHIQQNQIENLPLSLTTSTLQENNEQKPVVAKYVNQLVFKSTKREQMYVVDKKLLFDIQFEVPKYYVNIY